ncbi:MAG: J domain-containing protein [Chitinophagaceae bacterium]|nr:J domain-containing protein [Chitinophagaceae bacterium]
MAFKDYYKTLGVTPDCSPDTIKKKFRKLALQYHPDKNAERELATLQFREIQEAYETLSHPSKRAKYHFEWKLHFPSAHNHSGNYNDPLGILNECTRLNNEVAQMDIFRANREGIFLRMNEILSAPNINLLLFHKEEKINEKIITQLLSAARVIPFKHITAVTDPLVAIAGTDDAVIKKIRRFIKTAKQQYYWEKIYPVFVLLITILVCLFIYRASQ